MSLITSKKDVTRAIPDSKLQLLTFCVYACQACPKYSSSETIFIKSTSLNQGAANGENNNKHSQFIFYLPDVLLRALLK